MIAPFPVRPRRRLALPLAFAFAVLSGPGLAQGPAELSAEEARFLGAARDWAALADVSWERAELDAAGVLFVHGARVPFGALAVHVPEMRIAGTAEAMRIETGGRIDLRLDGATVAFPEIGASELVLTAGGGERSARLRISGLRVEALETSALMQPDPDTGRTRAFARADADSLDVVWAAGQGVRFTASGVSWRTDTNGSPNGDARSDSVTAASVAGRVHVTDTATRFDIRSRSPALSSVAADGAGFEATGATGTIAWNVRADERAGRLVSGVHLAELTEARLAVSLPGSPALVFEADRLREELQALAGAGDTLSLTLDNLRVAAIDRAGLSAETAWALSHAVGARMTVALIYDADTPRPTVVATLFSGGESDWWTGEPGAAWMDRLMAGSAMPETVSLSSFALDWGPVRVTAEGQWTGDPSRTSRAHLHVNGLRGFLDAMPSAGDDARPVDVLDAIAARLGTDPDAVVVDLARGDGNWTVNGEPADRWMNVLWTFLAAIAAEGDTF